MEADLLQAMADPGDLDALDNLADPGDDWVSLFLEKSEEFDAASLADLLAFPDDDEDPLLTASPPSSGLSSQDSSIHREKSPSPGLDVKPNSQQQQPPQQPSSSEDSNSSRSTSSNLGKRKVVDVLEDQDQEQEQDGDVDEEEVKRRARLMRNRESAQLSRQRKKAYVDDLEERVRALNSTVAELNNTVSLITAENVNLRNQLAYFYHNQGGGGTTGGKPGTFTPPIGVPVFPYPGGYVMRPRSVNWAPPVPIPRLKPQGAAAVKSVKRPKVSKEEARKPAPLPSPSPARVAAGTITKTKKLASVAAVGLLCIMAVVFPMDFGLPRGVPVSSSGWSSGTELTGSSSRIGGRVLMSLENESSPQLDWRPPQSESSFKLGCRGEESRAVIDGSVFPANVSYGNSSHRVPASLLLPRDDRVVKVDGDLIIQAVLAGNEAKEDTPGHAPPALLTSGVLRDIAAKTLADSNRVGKHRALPVGGNHTSEEDAGDAQRKVLNDLAGTVFSTGMCTEVFQFELSQGNGKSSSDAEAAPSVKRGGQHRRSLLPSSSSASEEVKRKKGNATAGGDVEGEKGASSMVVSVFNPKQSQNSAAGAKDLARIFVVVLVDSVKYVTYSCLLPPQPQVVTG